MFFTEGIDPKYRKEVSRLLVGMRIDGTLGRIVDESLDISVCQETLDPQLGPRIIIVPLAIAVFPPLILCILIVCLAGRDTKRPAATDPQQSTSQEMTIPDVLQSKDSATMSAVSGRTMHRSSTVELDEATLT